MASVTTKTMRQAVDGHAAYLAASPDVLDRTVRRYTGVTRAFLEFLADDPTPEDVSRADIDRFLHRRPAGRRPAPSTFNVELAALRSLFEHLFVQEVIDVNPARRIRRMPGRGRSPEPLSLDAHVRLVQAIQDHSPTALRSRNVALVQVLFHCGLRVSELVSLDLAQVDLGRYLLKNVRTKGDRRLSVAINDLVAEALEFLLADRAKLDLPEWERALFVSERSRRLTTGGVRYMVRRHARLAGIATDGRPVTPHMLRHGSATELVNLGVDLRAVQRHLGHASVRTTERYVHDARAGEHEAASELGAAWRAARRRELDGSDVGAQPAAVLQ